MVISMFIAIPKSRVERLKSPRVYTSTTVNSTMLISQKKICWKTTGFLKLSRRRLKFMQSCFSQKWAIPAELAIFFDVPGEKPGERMYLGEVFVGFIP